METVTEALVREPAWNGICAEPSSPRVRRPLDL
jgi:hypothetical protein